MAVRIITGDAVQLLQEMEEESIHCVITSPPYWGLRSYGGDPGMIGMEDTLEEHLENIVSVFREIKRVLRKDGTCWLNCGDAYAGSWGGYKVNGKHTQRKRNVEKWNRPIVIDPNRRPPATRKGCGFKPKNLMLLPSRVAIALQEDGAADVKAMGVIKQAQIRILDIYDRNPPDRVMQVLDEMEAEYAEAKGNSWWIRSEIVWSKPAPQPESAGDRPTQAHEKLFLLTKSPRYFYDQVAVRRPLAESSIVRLNQDIENQHGSDRQHEGTKNQKAVGTSEGANLCNVWTIPKHAYKGAHFATFPPALVEPCIKAGTSDQGCCDVCGAPLVRKTDVKLVHAKDGKLKSYSAGERAINADKRSRKRSGHKHGGLNRHTTIGWEPTCDCDGGNVSCTVLDPFGGSGTVGLVADRLQRDAVLIEINPDYALMAKNRIYDDAPLLVSVIDG